MKKKNELLLNNVQRDYNMHHFESLVLYTTGVFEVPYRR